MMDRLTSMAAFVTAADVGSFAAAAAQLGMSPQMVAKHVTFLEDRLGSRLLNRTTRRQSLTEVGRAYHERCKIVLAEADAADALAQERRALPRGRLRITAPVTFGAHSLMPLVTRYLRDHPEVEIDLALTDRFVDLVEEGREVAFRVGLLDDSGLLARSLAPYRLPRARRLPISVHAGHRPNRRTSSTMSASDTRIGRVPQTGNGISSGTPSSTPSAFAAASR